MKPEWQEVAEHDQPLAPMEVFVDARLLNYSKMGNACGKTLQDQTILPTVCIPHVLEELNNFHSKGHYCISKTLPEIKKHSPG